MQLNQKCRRPIICSIWYGTYESYDFSCEHWTKIKWGTDIILILTHCYWNWVDLCFLHARYRFHLLKHWFHGKHHRHLPLLPAKINFNSQPPIFFRVSPDRHLDRNPHQLAWCQRHTILKQLLDVTNQIQERLFFLRPVSNRNHKFFVSALLFLTIQISNYKECCTTVNLKNQVIKNWPMREAHLKREYSTLNDRADHLLLLNWYLHMLVLIISLIQVVKNAAKILPILEQFSTIDSFSNPKLEKNINVTKIWWKSD